MTKTQLEEFLKEYHINKTIFAEIAGVGVRTLNKYANELSIREESKRRIEAAVDMFKKYNLKRPVYDNNKFKFGKNRSYNGEFWKAVDEFNKQCKENFERYKAEGRA